MDMNIFLIILAILVFLMTTMYLERTEFCVSGIYKILGSTSITHISYFVTILMLFSLFLVFYFGFDIRLSNLISGPSLYTDADVERDLLNS